MVSTAHFEEGKDMRSIGVTTKRKFSIFSANAFLGHSQEEGYAYERLGSTVKTPYDVGQVRKAI
jgi:hypothetical protein